MRRKLLNTERLQYDEAGGRIQYGIGDAGCCQVGIQIGASEGHDDGSAGPCFDEALDRGSALAGMESYENIERSVAILLGHLDLVAQVLEYALPTERGDSIAVIGPGRGRGNDADPHSNATVRKPANTSRRSGVK